MIKVDWGNSEHKIIVWKFSTPWTFNEFYAAQKRVNAMIEGVEGTVDSIFLTSAEQTIPARAVTHLRAIIAKQHKRHRYIVVVGAKSMLTALLNIIVDLVPNFNNQLKFVQTQSEAYSLIQKLQSQQQSSCG